MLTKREKGGRTGQYKMRNKKYKFRFKVEIRWQFGNYVRVGGFIFG